MLYITTDHRAAWAARVGTMRAIAVAIGIQANGRRTNANGDPMSAEASALLDERDDLHARLQRLVARNKATIDAADAAGRPLTEQEQHTIKRRCDDGDQLQARIDAIDDELDRPGPRRTPASSSSAPGSLNARGPVRVAPVVNLAVPPERPSAAALFGMQATSPALPRQEDSFGRWLYAVAARDTQFLLTRSQMAGANTLIGTEGGFAVPPAWSGALLDAVIAQSFFVSRCRVLPMAADKQSYPMLNSYDRTKGPAKLTAERKKEGVPATEQTPTLEELTLTAVKNVTYFSVTQEMMQGGLPGTDAALIAAAAGAIAMQIDREVWAGTGVAQFIGINGAPATIVQTKDGSQPAATISYTNLTNMLSRLHPSSYRNAIWVASPSTLPQLLGVAQLVKNVAGTENVGGLPAPVTQLADGSYAVFGRPLVISDFSSVLGTVGDLSLIDLSQYLVGLREELRVDVSPHVLFAEDKVAFKVVQRRAGQPIPQQTFTPAVGSTTLSPFVQLETR